MARWLVAGAAGALLVVPLVGSHLLHAQSSTQIFPVQRPLGSLKTVPVPGPTDQELAEFVRDKTAAVQLGKALFWDARVGSDNRTACATCHFHAGADNRITNQINPGLLAGDTAFQAGGNYAGPNYTLRAADFPLTRHGDIDDAGTIAADVNDVVSSQGVFTAKFDAVRANARPDDCTVVTDSVLHGGTGFDLNGVNTRRVEPRNTPSVINAVFNFRNFWDGRGNNVFNGGDPFGLRNTQPLAWKFDKGVLRNVAVSLSSSSLASQASGPPMSGNEMSCQGRAFVELGQKLLKERLLADQDISPRDSVLGAYALRAPTYAELIRKAFRPEFWSAPVILSLPGSHALNFKPMDLQRQRRRDDNDFDLRRFRGNLVTTQMEANFALFFGIAVQMYEATLVSDDTPFDRFAEGDRTALTAQQMRGLMLYQERGRCISCHGGPETTNAAFSNVQNQRVERMTMGDGAVGIYDTGFYNIGVRPTREDIGLGGNDAFGNPLSETRMAQLGKGALLGNGFGSSPFPQGQRIVADGAFKAPGLRNVEFTGPYFHNGGKSTLMQVIDFYNRGGDFAYANRDDFDFHVGPIGLSQAEKEDLVSFLLSLSDDRVRYSRAPFDHPSICMPNGHQGGSRSVAQDVRKGTAIDLMQCVQAVGADGTRKGLQTFLGLSPFAH
ncbi:cytochrome-c peroxidase [Cupriavidus sp. 2TAF22]|uniref:cytochrome-c peroxidase n=1 Tax=unclassified Cupriavidus TaxID=2640874 RepID=UPI003F8ED8A9